MGDEDAQFAGVTDPAYSHWFVMRISNDQSSIPVLPDRVSTLETLFARVEETSVFEKVLVQHIDMSPYLATTSPEGTSDRIPGGRPDLIPYNPSTSLSVIPFG